MAESRNGEFASEGRWNSLGIGDDKTHSPSCPPGR
jgi:hypothetical protein